MSTDARAGDRPAQWGLAALGAVGLAVAAALAAYAEVHPGDGAALTTLGFSGMLQMKAWLTTAAAVLVVVQVAVRAWRCGAACPACATRRRWVTPACTAGPGTVAFLLTLPVVFHCVWSLGFEDESARVLVHSVAGCAFYGVFAAKMLALRLRRPARRPRSPCSAVCWPSSSSSCGSAPRSGSSASPGTASY